MLARVGRGLTVYRDNLLQAFNVFLLAAAAASLLWRAPDARLNALRGFAAFCLLAVILVTALFAPAVQIIAPFAPLITVVAVGFVFSMVAEQDWDPLLQRHRRLESGPAGRRRRADPVRGPPSPRRHEPGRAMASRS